MLTDDDKAILAEMTRLNAARFDLFAACMTHLPRLLEIIAELEADNASMRREILAAGNEDFDWSVLGRLDRLDGLEAEVARLKGQPCEP